MHLSSRNENIPANLYIIPPVKKLIHPGYVSIPPRKKIYPAGFIEHQAHQ